MSLGFGKKLGNFKKVRERSANVYENKGPAFSALQQSGNVIDGKGDGFQKPESFRK
jgi:hypothetical protein